MRMLTCMILYLQITPRLTASSDQMPQQTQKRCPLAAQPCRTQIQLHGRLQCDDSELCPSKPSHRFPPKLQKSARPPARSLTANAILHGSRNFQHPGVY
ncbi:hypothetical protein F5882DRAFT_394791 [Hyaloscypha sp. PMI_1271]|nr:hypothetical protein F5882DRAFT_394791 [Hyaloscypha sp. PMI_1271]